MNHHSPTYKAPPVPNIPIPEGTLEFRDVTDRWVLGVRKGNSWSRIDRFLPDYDRNCPDVAAQVRTFLASWENSDKSLLCFSKRLASSTPAACVVEEPPEMLLRPFRDQMFINSWDIAKQTKRTHSSVIWSINRVRSQLPTVAPVGKPRPIFIDNNERNPGTRGKPHNVYMNRPALEAFIQLSKLKKDKEDGEKVLKLFDKCALKCIKLNLPPLSDGKVSMAQPEPVVASLPVEVEAELLAPPSTLPVVLVDQNKKVHANSKDVALFLGKEPKHVLRDIDNLQLNLIGPNLDRSNMDFGDAAPVFIETTYVDAQGRTQRSVDMNAIAVDLLVSGYRGSQALAYRMAYVQEFRRREEELRKPTAADVVQMIQKMLDDNDKLLTENNNLRLLLEAPRPENDDVDHNDIPLGFLTFRTAAKTLGVKASVFNQYLDATLKWTFMSRGHREPRAHISNLGLLKLEMVYNAQRTHKFPQTFVTPKGYEKLVALKKEGAFN